MFGVCKETSLAPRARRCVASGPLARTPNRDDVTAESDNRGALRARMRRARRAVPPEVATRVSAEVVARLTSLPQVLDAQRVALYRAFDGEPNIEALDVWARTRGKEVVYPRHTRGSALEMVHAGTWRTQPKGPPVPEGHAVAFGDVADVAVVPGVAFDEGGYRLGLGGGHYDRSLPSWRGFAIGVCYDFQCLERLPRESWDWPVSLVVTERRIHYANRADERRPGERV